MGLRVYCGSAGFWVYQAKRCATLCVQLEVLLKDGQVHNPYQEGQGVPGPTLAPEEVRAAVACLGKGERRARI